MSSNQLQNKKTYLHNLRFYNLLSSEEAAQFKDNVEKYSVYGNFDVFLEAKKSEHFKHFIGSAFNWAKTPEGHNYWQAIAHQDVYVNTVIIDTDELTKDQQLRHLAEENQQLKIQLAIQKVATPLSEEKEVLTPWKEIFFKMNEHYKYNLSKQTMGDIFMYLWQFYEPPHLKREEDEADQTT
jgi:hypothetical protein